MGSDGGLEEAGGKRLEYAYRLKCGPFSSLVPCVYPLHRMAIAVKEEDYGQERGTEAQNREAEKQLTEK